MLVSTLCPGYANGCQGTPCQFANPRMVRMTNGVMMMTTMTMELTAITLRPRMLR